MRHSWAAVPVLVGLGGGKGKRQKNVREINTPCAGDNACAEPLPLLSFRVCTEGLSRRRQHRVDRDWLCRVLERCGGFSTSRENAPPTGVRCTTASLVLCNHDGIYTAFFPQPKWYGADKDNPPSYVQAGCQFNNSQSGWVNQRVSLKLWVSTPPEHCSYKHNPTYQTAVAVLGLYETTSLSTKSEKCTPHSPGGKQRPTILSAPPPPPPWCPHKTGRTKKLGYVIAGV